MQRKSIFGNSWSYDYGVILKGVEEVYNKTGDGKYLDFIERSMERYIGDEGNIKFYNFDDKNIDFVNNGKVLLFLAKNGDEARRERYLKAAALLRKQLNEQPRTGGGAFWHKNIYPYQIWLDGVYMGSPFYAQYIREIEGGTDFSDVVRQFELCFKHTYDENTGLMYHCYDESREVFWCDKATGLSPHFWGRAIGWYAMACVDALDFIPENDPGHVVIRDILVKVVDGMLRHADATGVWWQIVDMPGKKLNYLESSVSCMMVYAMAKGIVRGYLDRDKYNGAVRKCYDGIMAEFVQVTELEQVNLNKTCKGAGLGPGAHIVREGLPTSVNLVRDGTFVYYVSEPIVSNDPKGYGAFVLASKFFEEL
jgi:unsaturated rhamnogalacturonyl hydrolase